MANSYTELNCLDEVSFIGGNEYVFEYTVYDVNSVALDISSATVEWNMSLYGQQDHNILTKSGVITDTSEFTVTLLASETEGLEGKYVHQAVITDFTGSKFIPAQGIVTILPKISNT